MFWRGKGFEGDFCFTLRVTSCSFESEARNNEMK
jgi:hypothetical protein